MTITVFETALEEIRTRRAAFPDTDQDFQKAEAQLHTQQALLEDFATAALEQGRAQFPSGEEREILDAVPDAPATHIPGKGEITLRSSPGAGAVKLKFDAAHATRFDVLHAEPESSDWPLEY